MNGTSGACHSGKVTNRIFAQFHRLFLPHMSCQRNLMAEFQNNKLMDELAACLTAISWLSSITGS